MWQASATQRELLRTWVGLPGDALDRLESALHGLQVGRVEPREIVSDGSDAAIASLFEQAPPFLRRGQPNDAAIPRVCFPHHQGGRLERGNETRHGGRPDLLRRGKCTECD